MNSKSFGSLSLFLLWIFFFLVYIYITRKKLNLNKYVNSVAWTVGVKTLFWKYCNAFGIRLEALTHKKMIQLHRISQSSIDSIYLSPHNRDSFLKPIKEAKSLRYRMNHSYRIEWGPLSHSKKLSSLTIIFINRKYDVICQFYTYDVIVSSKWNK